MVSVDCPFISIGANRHPSAADWSPSGLLAFGAGCCIALWNPLDPSLRGVHATLKGHADRVNAVRFLPGQSPDTDVLLSGSVDQSIKVWSGRSGFSTVWTSAEGTHRGSINAIATCAGDPSIFAAASADGTVAVYRITTTEDVVQVTHLQSLSTAPKFYPLTLALATLPPTASTVPALILAIAGSSTSISIYLAGNSATPFTHQATLSGHENWIRSLSFTPEDPLNPQNSDLLLASASQDKYVRLWRVHPGSVLPPATAKDDTKTYGLSTRLSNKAHKLRIDADNVWSVTFEALLMGHEDWVYAAAWRPGTLQLLSASADSSLGVWAPEVESGIWVTTSRLGEISDVKGASTATGSVGGLWTGLWSPDGGSIVAFGKTGSWRVWRCVDGGDRWLQEVGVSGHVKDAMGCSWGKEGAYLLSTGLDQTTRLFAEWVRESGRSWHEMARPQIHGYDINCVAALGGSRFVSGADEKLVRVFDEPKGVAGLLEKLCGIREESMSSMPDAANVPVLGLSNKATDDEAPLPLPNGLVPDEPVPPAPGTSSGILDALSHPPLEDHLCRHTLWPEHEKLYGHGYEISTIAASPGGALVATAARASTAEHAVIRLFETSTWREVKPPLAAHSLTVTGLSFGPHGRLLSVGRDRAWAVFEDRDGWKLVERRERGHGRMILDGSWAPEEVKGDVFVTAGRDRCVKIWKRPEEAAWECVGTVKFEVPVTAVDFLGVMVEGWCWFAVGLEDGGMLVYRLAAEDVARVEEVVRLDDRITPDKAVTQIAWRPVGGKGRWEMAVASEDCSVRVYGVGL